MGRKLGRIISIALVVLATGTAHSQSTPTNSGPVFPHKPIRIVTSLPGGGSDLMARIIAQGLPANLGQPIVVENRPGGVVPGEIVFKAPPDGYTLLVSGNLLWLQPFMKGNRVPYDPVKNFAPVSLVTNAPNILVVHPSVAAASVKELIALAKAKPGVLNCSTAATASSSHLALELFKSMAGVDVVRIPYKGNVPAVTDLMGGQVQMSFATPAAVTPHAKSGKLKILAVTSLQPFTLFPGAPTMAASGLPGYESGTITGLFAPAKTPAAIVNKLYQEVARGINAGEVKDKLLATGVEVVAGTPAQLAAAVKSEMSRLGKVIKDNDIRDE